MGQETSSLAQQSINISAGGSHATSTNEIRHPNGTDVTIQHRYTGCNPSGHSGSPDDGIRSNAPLPHDQHAHSRGTRVRLRSPLLVPEHGSGRGQSPGIKRHMFVGDHVGERHMWDDYRMPQSSPRSPNVRFDIRDDGVHQHPPISRRVSDDYINRARNPSSPNTARERVAFHSNDNTLDGTHGLGGKNKIDFDGLRDVPTGPKRGHRPCICISSRNIRNPHSLTRHLDGMLGSLRPDEHLVDESGWYIFYDDSPAGLKKLRRCYETFHKKKLFDEYELYMEFFPNGKPSPLQQRLYSRSSGGRNENSSSSSPHQHTDKTVALRDFGSTVSRQITNPGPELSRSPKISNAFVSSTPGESDVLVRNPSHLVPCDVSEHSTGGARVHGATPTRPHTTLLSLRSDLDETASLASGTTRSDISRAKANKCHRCDGDTAPGSPALVRCSTCRRQYHRRCHQDPVIPAHLSDDHSWICARCVKKRRIGIEASKRDVLKPASMTDSSAPKTDALSVGVLDGEQREQPDSQVPVEKKLDAMTRLQVDALDFNLKSPQNEFGPPVDTMSNVHVGIIGGDILLSDADDLVARSFAAAKGQTHVKPRSQNHGKLKLTRIKLPPKTPSKVTEWPPNENWRVQDSATIPTIKPDNRLETNETVARNSVADLRALAHERHQATIKSGTESSFNREYQPHRQTAALESVKLSSAQQPFNEPRAPQQPENSKFSSTAFRVAERTVELEIPDSLDEARRGVQSRGTMTSNPRSLAKVESADTRVYAERTEAYLLHPGKPPALKGPRAPLAAQCGRCRKTIPRGPSGKNKLCSGCKKGVAINKEVEVITGGKSALSTSAPRAQVAFAPFANVVAGPQVVGDQADLSVRTPGPALAREEQQAAPQTNKDRVQIDGNPVQPPANTGHSGGSTAKTINSDIDGDLTMQEAITLGPGEHEKIHNPLTTRIQGELQFSPTVQMQLLEDSSVSEFKCHQSKRIPIENEIARTDGKVLGERLEGVLTIIDDRPLLGDQARPTLDPVSTDHMDSTKVDEPDVPQSKLNFIKSIVGDSSQRPKGSRVILVAMALGSTTARRMQARDVMEWIDSTIPTYKKGEGNWTSRISAMLSQGKATKSGGGYWQEEEWQEGDVGKPGHRFYRLLPEKEEEMWTWCPVLREPLSPQSRRDARARKAVGEHTAKKSAQHASASSKASTGTPTSAPITLGPIAENSLNISSSSFIMEIDGKPVNANSAETASDDPMEIDKRMPEGSPKPVLGQKRKQQSLTVASNLVTPDNEESLSDEDEPLSARLKRMRAETLLRDRAKRLGIVQVHASMNTETEDQSDPEHKATASKSTEHEDVVDGIPDDPKEAPGSSVDRTRPGLVTLKLKSSQKSHTADKPDRHIHADHKQFAPSLYKEWPEYCQPVFDERDKLAEIRARPRKKQLFGKLAPSAQKTTFDPMVNLSPEKRSRKLIDPIAADPYFWENPDVDPTRQEYNSLEEFFDFPRNVVPIVSEGHLAYRDGTTGADGGLPRAREIFKP